MTAQLTSVFVLPADVLLIPVEQLEPATRDRLNAAAGDVAITRPRSRRPSSVVDANGAALIELFRAPCTVVDAIMRFSRATNADPRVVLEGAFPLVERLVTGGVLLPSDDERARPIEVAVQRGATIGGFTIIDRVQVLEDVEIHRARSADGAFVAIKIARRSHADGLRAALRRESAILARLEGRAAPALVATDLETAVPWLATAWCSGVPPTRALDDHQPGRSPSPGPLLTLCGAIADAYATLHERGVFHGDVHDGNVLVDADGRLTILDFGIAAVPGDATITRARRGGVAEYYDPQYAASLRDDTSLPALDSRAEQYSVAALIYAVATGQGYLDLSLRRDEALRQIVEDPPLSFEARGATPWPTLEAILVRALSKHPGARYPSMRAMALALAALEAAHEAPAPQTRSRDRRRLIDTLVSRLEPGGPLFTDGLPAGPVCSINNGAAGIAYAFYRMAIARESATLLTAADAWIARAKSWCAEPEAWYTKDHLVSRKEIGSVALYHTATGLHCVDYIVSIYI